MYPMCPAPTLHKLQNALNASSGTLYLSASLTLRVYLPPGDVPLLCTVDPLTP